MDFEELGKKLKKFSQDTVTEVQKMNEVRQLNGKISDEKKLLNRLYLEMGQKLYDTYKDVELPLEEFDFRKIRERYVAIDLLQEKIRNVKGVVLCPCCNMEVAAGDRYCTNCGNKMPETVKLEETTDEDAVEVESTVVEPEAAEAETESADKAEETCEAAKQTIAEDETTSEEETEAAEPESAEAAEAAEEAVCEAAEETGACARGAHQEETVATDELAADAEAAVEEAEEETAKEAAESTSEE